MKRVAGLILSLLSVLPAHSQTSRFPVRIGTWEITQQPISPEYAMRQMTGGEVEEVRGGVMHRIPHFRIRWTPEVDGRPFQFRVSVLNPPTTPPGILPAHGWVISMRGGSLLKDFEPRYRVATIPSPNPTEDLEISGELQPPSGTVMQSVTAFMQALPKASQIVVRLPSDQQLVFNIEGTYEAGLVFTKQCQWLGGNL